jgi:hypothetical protein
MNSRVRYWNGRACQAPAELPLPAPPAAGGRDAAGDPRGGRAAVRAGGLPGDDRGAGRGRGRGGAQDRLRRLHDQERAAPGAVGPAPQGRPGPGGRRRPPLVPGGRRRARPRAPAAAQRRQRPPGQATHRGRAQGPPVGGPGGPRRRGALAPDPGRLPRQPARDRGVPARQAGPAAGPGRGPGHRHPVDPQPPDVWLLLVGERGWTPGQWERWFADTACAQLLGPTSRTSAGRGGPGRRRSAR